MHRVLLFISCGLLVACSHQPNTSAETARPSATTRTSPANTAAIAPAPLPEPPATNELVYAGTIGRYPVVLTLQMSDTTDEVIGRYYYLRRGSDLALTGHRWSDSLELSETQEPPENREYFEADARLRARFSSDSLIQGYWQAEGKRQRLHVLLRRRRQAYDYAYAARTSPDYWLNGAYVQPVRLTDDSPNTKPDSDEFLAGPYTDVRYPLVAGLADKHAEARLNDLLSATQPTFLWSNNAWTLTRLHPEKEYPWLNACYVETVSLELLTPELVSIAYENRKDGCGAPPYEVHHQYTVLSLPWLRLVPLADVLQGDYQTLFRRYVEQELTGLLSDEVNEADSNDPNERCTKAHTVQMIKRDIALPQRVCC